MKVVELHWDTTVLVEAIVEVGNIMDTTKKHYFKIKNISHKNRNCFGYHKKKIINTSFRPLQY